MQQITPTIRLMTPEEVRTNRLANAGSVLQLESSEIPIGAGRGDKVHVFKESTVAYVLSINTRHSYISLEIFDISSGEEFDCIFLQYQWEIENYLGKQWQQLEPQSIVTILMSKLY